MLILLLQRHLKSQATSRKPSNSNEVDDNVNDSEQNYPGNLSFSFASLDLAKKIKIRISIGREET